MKANYFPKSRFRRAPAWRCKGFALVVTLSLMVLLVIVATGLLTLASIELRRAGQGGSQAQARTNARLALMLAIGELQATMGSDRAISAPAAIGGLHASDVGSGATADSNSGFLGAYTGVWQAADSPRDANSGKFLDPDPVYPDKGRFGSGVFKKWLVSNGKTEELENEAFFDGATSSSDPGFDDPVVLVGEGSVSSPGGYLRAGLIPSSDPANKSTGKLAYVTLENNTKAFVAAKDLDARDDRLNGGDMVLRAATSGAYGLEAFDDLQVGANTPDTDKVIFDKQLELLPGSSSELSKRYFHDVTAVADSLLTDVTTGGVRKDLSLFFEGDPESGSWDVASRINPGGAARGPYQQRALSEHLDYDTGSWSTLRSHYMTYRDKSRLIVTGSGSGLTVGATQTDAAGKFSDPQYAGWNNQRKTLSPVLVRFNVVLSVGAYDSTQRPWKGDPTDAEIATMLPHTKKWDKERNKYIMTFHAFPMATIWNPYNVPLELPGFSVVTTGMSMEHFISVTNGVNEIPYQWNLLGESNNTSDTPSMTLYHDSKITLYPGEVKTIFGSTTDNMSRWHHYIKGNVARNENYIDYDPTNNNSTSAGMVRNSFDRSSYNSDSDPNNIKPYYQGFNRMRAIWMAAGDEFTLRTQVFMPETDSNADRDRDSTNGHQGLLYYHNYASFNAGLLVRDLKSTSPENMGAMTSDSSDYASYQKSSNWNAKVGWRNDPANPVSIKDPEELILKRNVSELLPRAVAGGALPPASGPKIPFMVLDFRLKQTEADGDPDPNASIAWLHGIPSHPYSGFSDHGTRETLGQSVSDEQIRTEAHARPYTARFHAATGISDALSKLQIGLSNREIKGYMGNSYSPAGQQRLIAEEVPLAPLQSIAQLQHCQQVPIDASRWSGLGLQNYAIGNSFASPLIASDSVRFPESGRPRGASSGWGGWRVWLDNYWCKSSKRHGYVFPDMDGEQWFDGTGGKKGYIDHFTPMLIVDRSYVGNTLLWDDFFFSGLSNRDGIYLRKVGGKSEDLSTVVGNFLDSDKARESGEAMKQLPNSCYRVDLNNKTVQDVTRELESEEGYKTVASYIRVNGGFNVNSTSVPAWKAFLASNLNKEQPVTKDRGRIADAGSFPVNTKDEYIISRNSLAFEQGIAPWCDYRVVDSDDLQDLAEKIVAEVVERGPFRSIGEFVNRRLESGESEYSIKGALQAALDKSSVNDDLASDTITTGEINGTEYANEEAALQSRHAGTPQYVMQGDLLQTLGPRIQVRSDSFTIRAYGESADGSARAWCEAVVVRSMDYVDETASDTADATEADLSIVNRKFGRRFKMIGFRWLDSQDV